MALVRDAEKLESEVEAVGLVGGVTPQDMWSTIRLAVDNAYAASGGKHDNNVRVSLPAVFVDWLLQTAMVEYELAAARNRFLSEMGEEVF